MDTHGSSRSLFLSDVTVSHDNQQAAFVVDTKLTAKLGLVVASIPKAPYQASDFQPIEWDSPGSPSNAEDWSCPLGF
jgi:hypothetical protein